MKKILTVFSIYIILIISITSCKNSEANTSNTSKSYNISDFSNLNLKVLGDVYYEQSSNVYLKVTGSSDLIEKLKVSSENGTLSIELDNPKSFAINKKDLIFKVGSPKIEHLNFNSIGTFYLKNAFKNEKLSITNNGVGQIKIDDCQVSTFNLTSKGVGTMEIEGISNQTIIHSEGMGKIDCSNFKSENAKVINIGIGDISVYAKNNLDIEIGGVGNVKYYGNPIDVKSKISGLGKATDMNK
ncbi:MAG: DUF2807 domain-containing protein [Saprospiraceae bacterium]|jgi:hypothetical protein|nr:DUF2807 domain-containing protein [Saprospiraceae bacterium]HQU96314.1 DUF2807 domain-containing protein [Saprospiraceae bacterium]